MVCSEKELGLGDDHDGVMLFTPADLGVESLVAGTPLQDVLGDAVLDVEIIPNIARCASVIGRGAGSGRPDRANSALPQLRGGPRWRRHGGQSAISTKTQS
jgi:hypothetical protein